MILETARSRMAAVSSPAVRTLADGGIIPSAMVVSTHVRAVVVIGGTPGAANVVHTHTQVQVQVSTSPLRPRACSLRSDLRNDVGGVSHCCATAEAEHVTRVGGTAVRVRRRDLETTHVPMRGGLRKVEGVARVKVLRLERVVHVKTPATTVRTTLTAAWEEECSKS